MILKIKEAKLKKMIRNYYGEEKGFDISYMNFEFVKGHFSVMIVATVEIEGRHRDLYDYLDQQDVEKIIKSTMNKDVVISNININDKYEVTINIDKRVKKSKINKK